MKWKQGLVLVLIILIIIMTIFFIKYNNPLTKIEEDLISFIENKSNLSLKMGDVKYWPLNRIVINNLQLRKNNTLIISIPKVKINYNIGKLFSQTNNCYDSLTYISIEKPSIIARDYSFSQKQNQFFAKLQSSLQKIQIDINQGRISVVNENNNFVLNNLEACLQNNSLSLKTGLNLKKTELNEYKIDNFKVDNLVLNLNFDHKEWQGTLKAPSFALANLTNFFPDYKNIITIKGNGQALVNFKGFKSTLEEYSAKIVVKDSELYFQELDYIEENKINNVNGEMSFHSFADNIVFNNFKFNFCNNSYKFNGKLKFIQQQMPEINGQLKTDTLQLSHTGLAVEEITELQPAGEARLNLLVKGKLPKPELYMSLYIPQGMIGEEVITHFKTNIRYQNDFLYIDSCNLELNRGSSLKFSGVYNIDSKLYNFNIDGEDINIGRTKKYFDFKYPLTDVDGKLNFSLILNGKGLNIANMNANGKMEILSPEIGYNNYEKLTGELWFADKTLMVNNGLLKFTEGEIDFSGQLNLFNSNIDMNLIGKNLDIALINKFIKKDIPISGKKLDFRGELLNTIDSPRLDINLSLNEGKFKGLKLNNLSAHTVYNENKLCIDDLNFDSLNSHIKGSGVIDFTSESPEINANITTVDIECNSIYNFIDTSLPLTGNIDRVNLSLSDSLYSPVIKGDVNSEKLYLAEDDQQLTLTETNMSFFWQRGQPLLINELSAKQNNALLLLQGQISEENLNLDFKLNKFDLKGLNLEQNIEGQLAVKGTVNGNINNPYVEGNFTVDDIKIRDQKLQTCKGEFIFAQEKLDLKRLICNMGNGKYIFSGIVQQILTDTPYIDLNVKTSNGDLKQLLNVLDYKLPLKQDYEIIGNAQIKGYLDELQAKVKIEAQGVNNKNSCIKLIGELGNRFDLHIEGKNVKYRDIYKITPDLKFDMLADIDFNGNIKGPVNDLDINMETVARDAKINNTVIDEIRGNAYFISGKKLQLQQTIRINDNKLKLAGDIGFGDSREVNLNVNTREFPLAVITGILRPDIEVDGYLDGSLNMSGFVDDINLDGQINLSAKNIKLGLPASIDSFVGKIVFDKKEIQFSNIQGYYAGEPVNIRGTLSPFAGHDFWDINLTGENLPFVSGSIDGRFDPDITIKGSFKKPKIIGELLTHDLIIKIPFNIQGRFEKGIIEPELNIVLKPGNDIYVKNQYMNILVEEGSLILKKENGRYTLEGKVSSQQGSFDYYNNKFIMENGYADFRKFNNIPDIKASAYTYVKGNKIIININGPADNMLMTFHSQPELPRKEIINLLVSKGGLGELLSGKDTYLPDFIKKEIERFFQETLQLEFIANIEKKIKELFKLDRMEIDTYQLGSNKNISIYLGKRFNQKFYMQYETTLNLDDTINYAISESELSFYYYLNNKLHLESSWLGKDDFRITIETEFKF